MEMSPQLTQHLQIIATRFPDVFEELKGASHQQPDAGAKAQFLERTYGKSDSTLLIQRWVSLAPADPRRVVITTGFGDGRHLRTLLEALPNSTSLCVIECDPAMLLACLDGPDLSGLLNNPRFILLTPFSYREVIGRLNLELIGVRSTSTFLYTPLFERSAELYRNITTVVVRQLTTRWNQIKTDVDNAEVTFRNTIENFSEVRLASDVYSFHEIFKNRAFVLVAAGPSLDENLAFLKKIEGKAVIAVVNSAYRAAVRAGIRPDLTVAVDPKEDTFRGYEGADTADLILFCNYGVYPEVVRLFKDRVVPLSSYNFLMNLLRKILQLPEEPAIIGDATVSSTVINLAVFFGCSSVYLVGQDLAIRSTGQSHVSDSFYSDDGLNQVKLDQCTWIPGNHGEKVPVDEKLHAYLKIFENMVSHHASISFHNLAREGARIHGAPCLTEAQALQQIETYETKDHRTMLLQALERSRPDPNLNRAALYFFGKYAGFLRTVIDALLRFSVSAEMQTHLHGEPLSSSEFLDSALHEPYKDVIQQFEQNPLFTSLMVEGRSKKEYHDFICAEEKWSLITDQGATLAEILPQSWALLEGGIFQLEMIERYLFSQ